MDRAVTLCVSTEVALEYEEILGEHMGREVAETVMEFLESAPNVEWLRVPYRWRLIVADPDDDKFVDCAVAAGAVIVTEDRHLDVLGEVGFPPVEVVRVEGFRLMLEAV